MVTERMTYELRTSETRGRSYEDTCGEGNALNEMKWRSVLETMKQKGTVVGKPS